MDRFMPDSIRIGGRIVKIGLLGLALCSSKLVDPVMAAFERTAYSTRAAGRAGAGIAAVEPGCQWLNPAVSHRSSIALGWSEPFGLAELGSEFGCAQYNAPRWSGGIMVSRLGDASYSEQTVRGGANYAVGQDLSLGFAASWHDLAIQSLPSGDAATVDVGLLTTLRSDLRIGAVWRNLTRAQLSDYEDRLTESITVGGSFDVDSRTTAMLDAVQESGFPLEIRAGAQVSAFKQLILRCGVLFDPAQYALGLTLKHRLLYANYALQWHRSLGATHFIGLDIELK